MELSDAQSAAVDKFNEWAKRGFGLFVLHGYAGTGKTTIVRELIKQYDARVLTFTGKASDVLRRKGVPAKTVHSLAYMYNGKNNWGKPQFVHVLDWYEERLKELKADPDWDGIIEDEIDATFDLIVLDECSMINDKMYEDLTRFNVPILALGDPAQLPPVNGNADWFNDREPDVMLDEIHRHAADNPILQASMAIRNGEKFKAGDLVSKRPQSSISDDELINASQILCGKNATRRQINKYVRGIYGFEGLPEYGEKLICLMNNHELEIYNGAIYIASRDADDLGDGVCRVWISHPDRGEISVISNTANFNLTTGKAKRGKDAQAEIDMSFDFGYAITVHKSQGSEWRNVILYMEPFGDQALRRAWGYTAITRAIDSIVLAV
jgi:exodeoxyribonuclease V